VLAESDLPFGMIMEKDTVAASKLDAPPAAIRKPGERQDLSTGKAQPARFKILKELLELIDDRTAVIATTGKCGRELFTLADREQHLYQVGSMGCAAGMGLGVALNSDKPVVVLDGDGAALMKMGTFATVGAYAPRNLIHVLLDNGMHDSTGGQATVSPNVDFAMIAQACGYRTAWTCDEAGGFKEAMSAAHSSDGPHLIRVRISAGSLDPLGRPTVKPPEVARRFKAFLAK
jgi:phosphonopyruvate decarboxylase